MSDLLRLNKLFVTRQYEDDGTLIIETKSKNPRVPKRCCLLHTLDKNGTKRQRFRDHPVQGRSTARPRKARGPRASERALVG